ncbi:hypothetical protein [Thermomonospora catenispora]|uniref:hypothetical protein n=1 Tax=Thermomonospora catenispora TaxID=2493090 RepID=UPI0011232B22|nr:hypothetical protein [Thermomonospora catenispora]TNY37423.1 hypothetical protein EIO00_08165 [Thermomonospora catenispora]
MSQRTRLRRIGTVATAMSAGVMAMAIGAAPALAADPCPPGTDLESTLKNWECQWNNFWNPRPTASPSAPSPAPAKTTTTAPKSSASTGPRTSGSGEKTTTRSQRKGARKPFRAPSRTSVGGLATDIPTVNGDLRSYEAPKAPKLSSALPAPQVAPDAPPPVDRTLEQTRIAPLAAAGPRQGDRMTWVAIASGAAGMVGALHLSVLSRSLRRRALG